MSQKTDAARITELDIRMFQDESWRLIYFGVKVQGDESHKQCRRGSYHFCDCWLLFFVVVLLFVNPFPLILTRF